MCRWVGYFGDPIRPEELLYEPEHSLIHQSQASKFFENGVNGDGLGLGWYGNQETPGVYRNASPAWGDQNFRELCQHLETRLFLAHIRAATGTSVQQTNCHPFRYGNWIFVHNGFIAEYERLRRDLMLRIAPKYFSNLLGTTDSELMFHLALTFGLEQEPIAALERMAGIIEQLGEQHGVKDPLQMTLGVSDGKHLYAVRYASGSFVNSLFVSESVDALRALYPEVERLKHMGSKARAVVSEPLSKLSGAWLEVPVSTVLTVHEGKDDKRTFTPRRP